MNLEEISKFLKRNLPVLAIALGGIVLALMIYTVLTNFLVDKGEQKFGRLERPQIKNSLEAEVEYNVSNFKPDFPSLFKVYKIEGSLAPETLAPKLGFKGGPKEISGQKIWQTVRENFTSSKATFTYGSTQKMGQRSLNEEQAKRKAIDTIQKLGLTDGSVLLEAVEINSLLLGGSHLTDPAKGQFFDTYAINLAAKLDNVYILNNLGSNSLYTLWVGVDGVVRKIQGPLQTLKFTESTTYPLKNSSDLKKELKQGKAKIVSLDNPIKPEQKFNLTFTKAELAYYLPSQDEDYLQPIYKIDGLLYDGKTAIRLKALQEALKEGVFKKD